MSLDTYRPDGGSRPAVERTSKYEQFVLAAACALARDDEAITLDAIETYIGDREDYTPRSLQRATEQLVDDGLLERVPDESSGESVLGGRIAYNDEVRVPESAWDELIASMLDWTLGVGGHFEGGHWEFADTPRVAIGYSGDDLDGQLETPITPTTITKLTWRRRLVLGALRVREVQGSTGSVTASDVREQVGKDVIAPRTVQEALSVFVDDRLVERIEGDGAQYRTTLAGRAAYALFLRCWWNVVPDDRQPTTGTACYNGGGA